MAQSNCPCCSNKLFRKCCGPFLQMLATPKTVQQLMRSRFSAYAVGGYGDYLLATWHPDTRPELSAAALSRRELHWQSLQVLASQQQGDQGSVEFIATFAATDALDGSAGSHHEQSRFVRVAGKWLYVDGTLTTNSTATKIS